MTSPQSLISPIQGSMPNRWLETFFRTWVFSSISALLIVWALPHTIAARNIAIFTGLIAALGWLGITKPKLQWKTFWPSIFLLLVPVWVLLHYLFISELKEQQWQELSSTWLRVSAVVILGSIAGIMASQKPSRIFWLILSICLLPTLTFVLFIYQVSIERAWMLSSGIFYAPFKGKFSAVYFVICQVLVGFAVLSYAFHQNQRLNIWQIILGLALILIGIADFIAAHALNGILITGLCFFLCLIIFTVKNLFIQKHSRTHRIKLITFSIISFSILLAALYSYWVYDQRYEGKLINIIEDIKISTQLKENLAWVRDGKSIPYPLDSSGRVVNISTYERVSWIIKGFEFLQERPLGNGVSHKAFSYYMKAEFAGSSVSMTHSAWVDFGLGLGVPGLLLVWISILGVALRNFSKLSQQDAVRALEVNRSADLICPSLVSTIAIWVILGLFCFWMIGEVSEREYIEHYFFIIAFFGVATELSRAK